MLHQLVAFTETHLGESEPGFKSRNVRWCVDIAGDGRLLSVLPLGDGKRGESLSRCPDMHGMNAGGKAHFLVETAQTVALLFKANENLKKVASAEQRHGFHRRVDRMLGRLRDRRDQAGH